MWNLKSALKLFIQIQNIGMFYIYGHIDCHDVTELATFSNIWSFHLVSTLSRFIPGDIWLTTCIMNFDETVNGKVQLIEFGN